MPIVSSEITHDDPQVDGRRYIHERHVDDRDREYIFIYLADADWDAEASLTARVPPLDEQIRQQDELAQAEEGQAATESRHREGPKGSLRSKDR